MKRSMPVPARFAWSPYLLLLAMLAVGLPMLAAPNSASAQASSDVVWDRYDVTIDVRSDGTMHVTEYQVIEFDGQYSSGYAYIPLGRVTDIENASISVANSTSDRLQPLDYLRGSRYDGESGTYTYGVESGELAIDYAFDPTSWNSSDSVRVVKLEYDVLGGIRVYDNLEPPNQQVWWYAISQDVTDIAPVRQATVTVNLPEAVSAEELVAYPDDPQIDGKSIVWTRSDLGEGDEFEVRAQFPPMTDATAPAWQQADDQRRQNQQEAQERSDWAGFLLLIAGLVGTFGGGVAVLALWFARGRDPHVGMVAEYIETPPDDLRPGAIGVLVDEQFHSRDVVATVLDLANRGVLKMTPANDTESSYASPHTFTLLDHKEKLLPYEQEVIAVIFGTSPKAGQEVAMPTVAGSLASRNAEIAKGYYQELVDKGYFSESPERARTRWRRIFRLTPLAMGAVVVLIVVLAGAWSNLAFFPLVIGVLVMFMATGLSNAMPRKSMAGAESAAKWRAFRAYVKDIHERKDMEGAKAIFEKYLPYAVALGLAESWANAFAHRPVLAPAWTGGAGSFGGGRTVIVDRRGRDSRRSGGNWTQGPHQPGFPGGSGSDSGGELSIPSLQEASDSAAGGLQGSSDSFWGMLGTVAKAFAESSGSGSGSFGSSRSGGFSGGGGFGGGSRGGGGGGGGGRRGFR